MMGFTFMTVIFVLLEQLIVLSKVTNLRLVGAVGARDLLSLRLVGAVGARELCGDLIRKVIDSATGKVEKPGFFAVGSQTNELLQFKAGLIYH